VISRSQAANLADILLQDGWAGRDSAEFALAPRDIAIETGDIVTLPGRTGPRLHRVVRVVDGATRSLVTHAVEPALFETPGTLIERIERKPPPVAGKPFAIVLDLPVAAGEPTVLQYLAVHADPWPGGLAIWRSIDRESFVPQGYFSAPAQIGVSQTNLAPGPLWRWDRGNSVEVSMSSGSVASVSDASALADAIADVQTNPSAAFERASRALAAYRAQYSAAAVVPQYEALYARLARAAGGRTSHAQLR
jgi:hypothetical protein